MFSILIVPIQLLSSYHLFSCVDHFCCSRVSCALFMAVIVIIIVSLKFMRPKFRSLWMSHRRQSHLRFVKWNMIAWDWREKDKNSERDSVLCPINALTVKILVFSIFQRSAYVLQICNKISWLNSSGGASLQCVNLEIIHLDGCGFFECTTMLHKNSATSPAAL